ncbi:MAG: PQQ-dependent sugar dehydrogenase [Sedimenticola sp.]|nr:PQQ-dependent sugar dehydrogenase [Sedimenticola sp.]
MNLIVLVFLALLLTGQQRVLAETEISLPQGFQITTAVQGVADARSMALGDKGTLFIATRRAGKLYAARDEDGDGRFSPAILLAEGLRMPNGIAFHQGALYLAENHRLTRYDGIEAGLPDLPEAVEIARLPTEKHHGWRYLAMGPDGWLYLSIGAPCNSCNEPGYGTIIRMRPDGSERAVFAEGVRNSVGFDWAPGTQDLWFSDNGRDWLGDDLPPDEINRATSSGLHFGYPYCHAGFLADPEFGHERPCEAFTPPAVKLGAHVAPLGVRFYTGSQFPKAYQGQLFVAEHGSWNRSEPVGYRIAVAHIEGGRVTAYEPFATGWLKAGGGVSGRPVDLLVMPDGALLVSDDHGGRIYRISYNP